MKFIPTASQTVGPYFHLGCTDHRSAAILAGAKAKGERIRLVCRVFDGDGAPVPDAMVEIWQANAEGKYDHPDDFQQKALDPEFKGFGRLPTDASGACTFETVKPGRVAADENHLQAPHINVSVFARGILKRLPTRIYFDGDSANYSDPVLTLVPEDRRDTLLAHAAGKGNNEWRFNIYLCGERETVFFDV